MNLAIFVALITGAGAFFSFRAPTAEEMVASFAEAQRFYAEGAYDQAIERYVQVAKVHSRVLDAAVIQVEVGEDSFPVQEAALYQTGNAHSKLFADYRRFAEGGSSDDRREYRVRADSALVSAVRAFTQVINGAANPVLRGQAHGRLIELYFDAERYGEVIQAARRLIKVYGSGAYALIGYYNLGWAHFQRGEYVEAIASFEELVRYYPSGYRTDRSLFQIGESHLAMDQCQSAIISYKQLVDRQRIDELDADQLLQMKREKLAGLVDETALELAAKAEIRSGTCYGKLQRFDQGVESFRRVIELFASERVLVEEAYLRLADLYVEKGDTEQALATYREAIDKAADRTLRARIQYALAERLFAQAQYQAALSEYRIYLQGYGDIAANAGFSSGRVRYRMGSSYQQVAQGHLQDGDRNTAMPYLQRAVAQYDTILADASSPYALDARFNRALAWQGLGDGESQARALAEFAAVIEDGDSLYVQRALLQLGELYFLRGEYQQAVEMVRRILLDFPGSDLRDEAQMRLALALQADGELAGAVDVFVEVDRQSPYFVRSRMGSGHALVQLGQFERAVEILQQGVGQADEAQRAGYHYLLGQAQAGQSEHRAAADQFTLALLGEPDAALEEAIRLARGNAALALDDLAQGEEDLNWVIRRVDDPEKVRFAQEALSLFYLRQNRGGDALKLLQGMLQQAAGPAAESELLSRILDLYYEGDDHVQTQRVARRLLNLSFVDGPVEGRPYALREKASFILGDVLMRSGDAAAGAEIFAAELQRLPDGFFALNMRLNMATHYFSTGELQQAREAFVALDAGELSLELRRVVRFYLANAHYSLRAFKESRDLFAALLQEFPQSPQRAGLLFGLGESHYQLGDFTEAIGLYRSLLKEFPQDDSADDAQYNMAWCLIELGQEEEAMAAFALLLRRYPDSEFASSAQFTFGDHAYNKGAYEEALEAYDKVLQRYPQSEVALQIPRLQRELKEAVAYDEYERGLALMDSAEAQNNEQHFRAAIAVFDQMIERYAGTESAIGALSNKGVCLEGLGQWRSAVEVYDEVIELYENEKATRDAYQFAKTHREWIVTSRL